MENITELKKQIRNLSEKELQILYERDCMTPEILPVLEDLEQHDADYYFEQLRALEGFYENIERDDI